MKPPLAQIIRCLKRRQKQKYHLLNTGQIGIGTKFLYSLTTKIVSGVISKMSKLVELDARGLQCPLPLLKLKQQLNRMSVGDRIRVQTTDAGSVRDFGAFICQTGHLLHSQEEIDGGFVFLIEKSSGRA